MPFFSHRQHKHTWVYTALLEHRKRTCFFLLRLRVQGQKLALALSHSFPGISQVWKVGLSPAQSKQVILWAFFFLLVFFLVVLLIIFVFVVFVYSLCLQFCLTLPWSAWQLGSTWWGWVGRRGRNWGDWDCTPGSWAVDGAMWSCHPLVSY